MLLQGFGCRESLSALSVLDGLSGMGQIGGTFDDLDLVFRRLVNGPGVFRFGAIFYLELSLESLTFNKSFGTLTVVCFCQLL